MIDPVLLAALGGRRWNFTLNLGFTGARQRQDPRLHRRQGAALGAGRHLRPPATPRKLGLDLDRRVRRRLAAERARPRHHRRAARDRRRAGHQARHATGASTSAAPPGSTTASARPTGASSPACATRIACPAAIASSDSRPRRHRQRPGPLPRRSAEDYDGFEDDDGCPEADNDHDGVLDDDDECPDQAGPARATRAAPSTARVVWRHGRLVIFGKVHFETGLGAHRARSQGAARSDRVHGQGASRGRAASASRATPTTSGRPT